MAGAGAQSERKAERQRVIALLFRRGQPLESIYRTITAQYQVTARTVRRDIAELGASARRELESDAVLAREVAATLERMRVRAQRDDLVGQRADETLLRFFAGAQLRPEVEHTKLRKLKASADKAEAEAQLARDQSKALGQGMVVELTDDDDEDLTAGISLEDVAAASPTPLPGVDREEPEAEPPVRRGGGHPRHRRAGRRGSA